MLKKLQSIDSKAYKLSIGVPTHTSTKAVYKLIGILSLNEHRKLMSSKYIIKANSHANYIKDEINLRSDTDFPKRAQKIKSQQTIATYTDDLFMKANINIKDIQNVPQSTQIPIWELPKPLFDLQHTDMTKDENPNILTSLVKTHCLNTYSSHLHIYTDGSLLENNDCGAAFIIPQYRIVKSYYIGSLLSIFTAELTAIMMALTCLFDLIGENTKIVLFVDSLSVLKTLENFGIQTRADLVYEIYYLLYQLFIKNNSVTFCWIPSHCNILGNEQADKAAKRGAQRKANYIHLPIPISIEEYNNHLQNISFSNFFDNPQDKNFLKNCLIFCHNKFQNNSINYYRKITSLSFKLKLNSLKTKL